MFKSQIVGFACLLILSMSCDRGVPKSSSKKSIEPIPTTPIRAPLTPNPPSAFDIKSYTDRISAAQSSAVKTLASAEAKVLGRSEVAITDQIELIKAQKVIIDTTLLDIASTTNSVSAEPVAKRAENAQSQAQTLLSDLDPLIMAIDSYKKAIDDALQSANKSKADAQSAATGREKEFEGKIAKIDAEIAKTKQAQADFGSKTGIEAKALATDAEQSAITAQKLLGEVQTMLGQFALAAYQSRISEALRKAERFFNSAESALKGMTTNDRIARKFSEIKDQKKSIEQAGQNIGDAKNDADAGVIAKGAEDTANNVQSLFGELEGLIQQAAESGSQTQAAPTAGGGGTAASASPTVKLSASETGVQLMDWPTSDKAMSMTNDVIPMAPTNDHMSVKLPTDQNLTHVITGFYVKTGNDEYKTDLEFSLPALSVDLKNDTVVSGYITNGLETLLAGERIPLLVIDHFLYRAFALCVDNDCHEDYLEAPLFYDNNQQIPLLTRVKEESRQTIRGMVKQGSKVELKFFKLGQDQKTNIQSILNNLKIKTNYPTHPGGNRALKIFANDVYESYKKKQENPTLADFLSRIPLGNCQVTSLAALEIINKEYNDLDGNAHMGVGYVVDKKYADGYVIDLNARNHAFNVLYNEEKAMQTIFAVDITGSVSPYLEKRFTEEISTFLKSKLNEAGLDDFKLWVISRGRQQNIDSVTQSNKSILTALKKEEVSSISLIRESLSDKVFIINGIKEIPKYKSLVDVPKNDEYCRNTDSKICLKSINDRDYYDISIRNYDYSFSKKGGLAFSVSSDGEYHKYNPSEAKEGAFVGVEVWQQLYMMQHLGRKSAQIEFLNFPKFFEEETWYGINFKPYDNLDKIKVEVDSDEETIAKIMRREDVKNHVGFSLSMLKYTHDAKNNETFKHYINNKGVGIFYHDGVWKYIQLTGDLADEAEEKDLSNGSLLFGDNPKSRIDPKHYDAISREAEKHNLFKYLHKLKVDLKMTEK